MRMTNSRQLSIAIIGCGTLGTAISNALAEPRDQDIHITKLAVTVASQNSLTRAQKALANTPTKTTVYLSNENVKVAKEADIVILAFKPVKRRDVFAVPGFKEALDGKLIISIMAGVDLASLKKLCALDSSIESPVQAVRVMPNIAAQIRQATSLYIAAENTSEENLRTTAWILNQFGDSQYISETNFDISAVLVGCAGSLLLLAVDGLLDAAVAEGVRRPEATKMAMSSAIGMMSLVPAGEHPSVLREKSASPGGCSIRAVLELEKRGVRSAFTDALLAAARRSKEISSS